MNGNLTRRSFLKRGGSAAALAWGMSALPSGRSVFARPSSRQSLPDGSGRPRVLLFHDDGFPAFDTEAYSRETLLAALHDCEVRVVTADGLASALNEGGHDLLVTAHGSGFPEDAGMAILGHLAQGGNWLQLGGVPLAVPVRRGVGGWTAGPRRTRWHRKLGLTQAFPIDCGPIGRWSASPGADALRDAAESFSGSSAFALYWRLTSTKHFPQEDGSAGPRDAELRPLIVGTAAKGPADALPWADDPPIVAAVTQLDWLHGDYAGGRWVIATGDRCLPADLLTQLASLAACGALSLTVSPAFARYRPGEQPLLRLRLHRPRRGGKTDCLVEVTSEGRTLHSARVPLDWSDALPVGEAELPLPDIDDGDGRTPRFRAITVSAVVEGAGGLSSVTAESGYWIAADAAFERGTPLRRDGAALLRGDVPFMAAGTSYMAGDVQRNFLFEPNPAVWREDFRRMRETGINIVRTGIWYGWKRIMLEPGHIDEAALRAMDAFLLAAIEQDIPVIFSFFAFLPEAWGGDNPYLDPRAMDAQKVFVGAFARRYRDVPGLLWDLINEPSFSSPAQLWRCRPNYDRYERDAWHGWLRGRLPGMDDAARLAVLRDRWRSDSGEDAGLPALTDFDDSNLFSDRQPLKVLDYRLFAQDAFAGWVRALSAAIRSVDRPGRLIMVGQDEGGTMDRPNPQFFAQDVDITSVHSWWFNDDLLWDSIVTRAPGRPHLVQETGVMFYERFDGAPWRGENESARLVERKLAIAAGTGSAGYVQWLWNTNVYMPSDNEAAIGALRGDGSAKPEFAVLRHMSRFLSRVAPRLAERLEEEVVLVLPHADQFSVRGNGVRGARAAVRTMAYRCGVPLRAVSEYGLAGDTAPASLYFVPSAAALSEVAWQQLLARAHAGATVLVTGVLDRDEAWLPVPRSALFGVAVAITPVAQHESVLIDKVHMPTGFRGEDLQRVEKAVPSDGQGNKLRAVRHGSGRVLWCPLPVEMGEDEAALDTLYLSALEYSGIEASCRIRPRSPGILTWTSRYREHTLVTLVSELAVDRTVRVTLRKPDAETEAALPAGSAVLLLFDGKGRILDRSDRE